MYIVYIINVKYFIIYFLFLRKFSIILYYYIIISYIENYQYLIFLSIVSTHKKNGHRQVLETIRIIYHVSIRFYAHFRDIRIYTHLQTSDMYMAMKLQSISNSYCTFLFASLCRKLILNCTFTNITNCICICRYKIYRFLFAFR